MPAQTIDHETWKTRLIKELKNQTWEGIQWQTADGFLLEPLYDSENQEELGYLKNFHEKVLARQKSKPVLIGFAYGLNSDELKIADAYGQKEWYCTNPKETEPSSLVSTFRGEKKSENRIGANPENDPFFDLMHSGKSLESTTFEKIPGSIHIHASDVHQAGGSPVQELATALTAAAFYVDQSNDDFWELPKTIHLGAGPGFLMELCKIRAMQLLWMNFCSIHGKSDEKMKIRVQTSTVTWSKTDSDTNLLRHTLGTMAGILGGADELLIFPHKISKSNQLEACRLALDIGHLCLEESHLQDFVDPAAGSYLADALTHRLAKEAWTHFTNWTNTGWKNLFENQIIQKEVKKSANWMKGQFENGKISMVGVNVFPSDFSRRSDPFPSLTQWANSVLPPLFLDA